MHLRMILLENEEQPYDYDTCTGTYDDAWMRVVMHTVFASVSDVSLHLYDVYIKMCLS